MADEAAGTYHEADNSLAGLFGNLVNAGIGLGTNVLTNAIVPKTDAKQQTLSTPGAKVPATGAAFNWKPWAIGGGVVVLLVGALLFFRRKP